MSAGLVSLPCETIHEPSMKTTPTTTTAKEITDDMSDTLMLDELFEEDTKEKACKPPHEQALKEGEHKINEAILLTKGTIADIKQTKQTLSTDKAINHRSADKTKTSDGSNKTSIVSTEPPAKQFKKTQDNNNVKTNKKTVDFFI